MATTGYYNDDRYEEIYIYIYIAERRARHAFVRGRSMCIESAALPGCSPALDYSRQ